jgi:hypothetical protein
MPRPARRQKNHGRDFATPLCVGAIRAAKADDALAVEGRHERVFRAEVGVPFLLPRPDGILKEHGMGVASLSSVISFTRL